MTVTPGPMPKRPTAGHSAASAPPIPTTGAVPVPQHLGAAVFEIWPAGQPIIRVHQAGTDPRRFNPGYGSPTRFGFFADSHGVTVPVWYGGESLDVAIAETLFHELPLGPGAVLTASVYLDRAHGTVAPRRPLQLVKLADNGLRALGLRAHQLTDTDAVDYSDTVKWAQALHSHHTTVDGLVWMSRQFNSHRSMVLFGDRVKASDLDIDVLRPETVFSRGVGLGQLIISAASAEVLVEPPPGTYLS